MKPSSRLIPTQNNKSNIDTYKIFDIKGRIVLKGNLSDGLNQINVENLSKGLYILNTGNINQKFVKE